MMRQIAFILLVVCALQSQTAADGFVCAGLTEALLEAPEPALAAKAIQSAPTETRNAVLIFATFKGEAPADGAIPEWTDQIFDPDRPGSFTHFYNEMSQGRHRVFGEVIPRWYESDHEREFYLSDSPTEPGRTGEFSQEILRKVDADVDFARFDNEGPDEVPDSGDDDGIADVVFIAMLSAPANFLQGSATGIGALGGLEDFGRDGLFRTDDTDAAGAPIAVSYKQGTIQAGSSYPVLVGSMAHEYGHVLGLPDLFDTDFLQSTERPGPEHDSAGIGDWGLMGWGADGWHGDDGPSSFSAWSRMMLGWAHVSEQTQLTQIARMEPVGATASVHRVLVTRLEFFLLEYRTRHSYYDRNIPAEGLLVWHIYDRGYGAVLDLECADGRWRDAGFPLGKVPDPHGGEDNLDFWAHDAAYRDARGGNRGDATDPFDGESDVAFTADTNPASFSDDGNSSIEISDIHIDEGQIVVQVEASPWILSTAGVTVLGRGRDGVIIWGEPVDVTLFLRNDGAFAVRGVRVEVSSQDPLVEIVHGETIAMDLEIGAVVPTRTADDGRLAVRLRDFTGTHTASLSLEIYVGEELVGTEEAVFTGIWPRLAIREVRVVDSNGDGRAQIGESIRLDLVLDIDEPELLELFMFDLRSLHPEVAALGNTRRSGQASATTTRIRSEFMIQSGVEPGDMLGFELTVETSGVAIRKDTVYVEVGEGEDETGPRVARLTIERARDDLLLSMSMTDILESSGIRSVTAVSYTYRDTIESGRIALPWQESRFEATWPDVPEGVYLVRPEVEDEQGNLGVGAFQTLNLEYALPGPTTHTTSPWRFTGPPGDRWTAAHTGVAFSPSSPGVVYAKTTTALWLSVDGGDTWSRTGLMLQEVSEDDRRAYRAWPQEVSYRNVLVDALDPLTVYTTGNPLRSADGGSTWEPLSIPGHAEDAALLAAHPVVGDRLYGRRDQTLWISEDRGDSWRDSGLRGDWESLLIHPLEPHRVYAITPNRERTAEGVRVLFSGDDSNWTEVGAPGVSLSSVAADPRCPTCLFGTVSWGAPYFLFESIDGGHSWYEASDEWVGMLEPLIRTSRHGQILLYGWHLSKDSNIPVFARSDDGGATWQAMGDELGWCCRRSVRSSVSEYSTPSDMAIDPHNPEHTIALLTERSSRSTKGVTVSIPHSRDAALSWTYLELADPAGEPVTTMRFDGDGRLYAAVLANDGGDEIPRGLPPPPAPRLFVSSDGGDTWERRPAYWNGDAAFTSLVLDPFNPGGLLGLQLYTHGHFDYGASLRVSQDDGATWTYPTKFDHVGPTIVAHPAQRGVFYSAKAGPAETGAVLLTEDGGQTWDERPLPEEGAVTGLTLDTAGGGMLYASIDNRVYGSGDEGMSWILAGQVGEANLLTLEAQPGTNRLWAVAPEGLYRSVDGGESWGFVHEADQPWMIAPAGPKDWQQRSPNPVRVRFDPHDSERLFVVTPRQLLETRDGGEGWHSIGGGIAGYPWFNDVAVSPVDPNALFVATAWGIYRLDGRETAIMSRSSRMPALPGHRTSTRSDIGQPTPAVVASATSSEPITFMRTSCGCTTREKSMRRSCSISSRPFVAATPRRNRSTWSWTIYRRTRHQRSCSGADTTKFRPYSPPPTPHG